MEQRIKPIKRSNELVPLSRDHHDGLLLCWKIRQGLKSNVATERIVAYVLSVYENDLELHFKQEEELVFELLHSGDKMRVEAFRQHDSINSIYSSLKNQQDNVDEEKLLNRFEQELNDHIRFEERELFPYIEKTAEPDKLKEAGKLIEELHQGHECLIWEDEFWTMKK